MTLTSTPAVVGGVPVRSDVLPFARVVLGPEEEEAALRVVRSGWLTTGPEVAAFESELAAATGAREVVAVNSCTAALHLAFELLDRPHGEVITTPFTFASSIAAVIYAGHRPILVDVDDEDLTIDPAAVAAAVSERTVAILGVDYAGLPMRADELRAAVGRRDVLLVEDAAHSLGARLDGRPVGALADITCFSFYATKTITTGEGGALATEDADRAKRARELRLHGMTADAWRRYLPGGTALYDIARMGFKYNLGDIAAAIGRAQLAKEPILRAGRRWVAERLSAGLADLVPFVRLPVERAGATHAWHLYPLRLDLSLLSIDRNAFLEAMRAEGISCSVHFTPVHQLTAYRGLERRGSLEHAERAGRSEISLPIWPTMSERDVSDVIEAVRRLVRYYRRS